MCADGNGALKDKHTCLFFPLSLQTDQHHRHHHCHRYHLHNDYHHFDHETWLLLGLDFGTYIVLSPTPLLLLMVRSLPYHGHHRYIPYMVYHIKYIYKVMIIMMIIIMNGWVRPTPNHETLIRLVAPAQYCFLR